MAAVYPFPVSAYRAPSPSGYRAPSPAYLAHVDSMFHAAPVIYHNMPVAPTGMIYPMVLPGYPANAIGEIHRPSSPAKQFSTNTNIRPSTPAPSIIPTRKWLLDTLKRYIFANHGLIIGDYCSYEIQKKDVIEKFNTRVAELYPRQNYIITKDWTDYAMENSEFLPEYSARLDEFPMKAGFRVIIKQLDFNTLAKDISDNFEPYFTITTESDELLDTKIRKITVCFHNHLILEGQRVAFFLEQRSLTNLLSINIPQVEMKYQHDYLAYDGHMYSLLDTYQSNYLNDQQDNNNQNNEKANGGKANGCKPSTTAREIGSNDSSITLYEIVNNIRNHIIIFMPYVDSEECYSAIQLARNTDSTSAIQPANAKLCVFDKLISPLVKLDFYIKVWGDGESKCTKCKVAIESGEIVCFTKCCRRTMHPSCLLELYIPDDCKHSAFKCDKCIIKRNDKYGRNTEILMGLCLCGY